MSTYQFTPQSSSPQVYQVMFDGSPYILIVYWLMGAQRYYFVIRDESGSLVLNMPLISSNYTQNLVAGIFTTSTMMYNSVDSVIVILP